MIFLQWFKSRFKSNDLNQTTLDGIHIHIRIFHAISAINSRVYGDFCRARRVYNSRMSDVLLTLATCDVCAAPISPHYPRRLLGQV